MTTMPRPPGPRDRAFGLRLLAGMQDDYLGFWRDAQRRYGDTIYMRHGWFQHYAFMHPDQMREALVDKAHAFIRYEQPIKVMRQLHGNSVMITEGATWQRQRRMLLPAFSPKRFEGYARQVAAAAAEAFDALDGAFQPVDVEHTMNMLAMDIILRTMFGSKMADDTAPIEQAIRSLAAIGYAEMFLPFGIPAWAPLPNQARKRKALRLLDGLVRARIDQRRTALGRGANAGADAGSDLLGMLLAARDDDGDGSALSDDEIRDQLMTIFLAGHETTATALAWGAWALAADPALAARMAAEADAVLGPRAPQLADLARLPLLAALVKETLRRYPPVPGVLMRRAIEDVRIGAWLVPKGSLVTIPFFAAHNDARWFAEPEQVNPDRMDPERFDPQRKDEDLREPPRGAYMPFGAGPRVCIGNSFALMEMTLVLAMLVQRFTLAPAPGQAAPAAKMQVTLRPAGGLRLLLSARRPAPAVPPAAPAAVHGCPFHA